MAVVHKITSGFVIQKYDENGVFLRQEFIAGDEVSYENEVGDGVDIPVNDTYVRFDMKQPYNFTDVELTNDCFNKLIAQGGCSVSLMGNCQYRGKSCRKCAIGLYIPDEDYFAELENGSAMESSTNPIHVKLCNILRSVGIKPHRMLVLQRCHDASASFTSQIGRLEQCRQVILALLDKGFTLESLDYNTTVIDKLTEMFPSVG